MNDITLPFSKDPIYVDWRRPDIGGLRIAGWTDGSGNPYIGVFTLDREGRPRGMPCWYERKRFLSHVVVGFDEKENPVKVFLDAEVTYFGLQASLQLPWMPANDYSYFHRRLSAKWGSDAPEMGFLVNPGNEVVAHYTLSEAI